MEPVTQMAHAISDLSQNVSEVGQNLGQDIATGIRQGLFGADASRSANLGSVRILIENGDDDPFRIGIANNQPIPIKTE